MGFKINICPYFSVIQLQNWCMYMRCMFCVSHTLHPNVCVRDAADAFVQCVINSFELFVPATYFFLPLTECTKQKKPFIHLCCWWTFSRLSVHTFNTLGPFVFSGSSFSLLSTDQILRIIQNGFFNLFFVYVCLFAYICSTFSAASSISAACHFLIPCELILCHFLCEISAHRFLSIPLSPSLSHTSCSFCIISIALNKHTYACDLIPWPMECVMCECC